jgi:hypothetical protein
MTTPPWKRPTPKSSAGTKLTPANLAWAKAAAKKAGRRYPNLIDNMAAARRQLEQEHRRNHPGLRDGL